MFMPSVMSPPAKGAGSRLGKAGKAQAAAAEVLQKQTMYCTDDSPRAAMRVHLQLEKLSMSHLGISNCPGAMSKSTMTP